MARSDFGTVLSGMRKIAAKARADALPVPVVQGAIDQFLSGHGWSKDEFKAAQSGTSNSPLGPIAQGFSFGLADEGRGLAGALKDVVMNGDNFGDAYQRNVAVERNSLEAYRAAHPVLSTGLEIGAGLVPGIGLAMATGGASAPATLGAAIRSGAIAGAETGGLYGFGQGEGLTDSATRGVIGAGLGGVIGGAAPAVVQGVKAGARQIGNMLPGGEQRAADYVVARAMQRDGVDPKQVADRVADAANRGVPLTPADVGGANMQGLADMVANAPGEGLQIAKKQLETRQMMGLGRITRAISNAFGTPRKALEAVAASEKEQKAAADPLYAAARAATVPDSVWAQFAEETTQGIGKDAHNSSLKLLQSQFGKKRPEDMPRFDVIDSWKQAMDDKISAFARTGEKNAMRQAMNQRDRVVSAIDAAVPEYAAARNAYAGPAKFQDAIEEGQKFAHTHYGPDELAAWWKGATQSEKDGFRIGAGSKLNAILGNDKAKLPDLTKHLRAPDMQRKIEIIIDDPAKFANWRTAFSMEEKASETLAATKNSRTAYRLAAAADAEDQGIVPETLRAIWGNSDSLFGTAKHLTGFVGRRIADTVNARRNAEIARLVLETDASKALEGLGRLGSRPAPSLAGPGWGAVAGQQIGGNAAAAAPLGMGRGVVLGEVPYREGSP